MEELLEKISGIYMRFGIKSVTMDDLARELGISKKTLYQHFKDKEDVVDKVLTYHLESHMKSLMCCNKEGLNAIDVLLEVSMHLTQLFQQMNPSVNYDLQKYYPRSWKRVNEFKQVHIYNSIRKNIEDGIAQGLYRSDLHIDIITKFYVYRMELPMSLEAINLKDYPFDLIFENLFIYHIRGIANKKGIEYLENKKKSKL